MVEIIDKGVSFKKGRFFWHVKGKNGKILCTSETYNSRQSAAKGLLANFKSIGEHISSTLGDKT